MGRKPYKNLNLPRGMRARRQKSGRTFYYYDAGGRPRKEIPLGPDYVVAVQKWAELEKAPLPMDATFRQAAERYVRDVLPNKSARSQRDNLIELEFLYQFFDDPPAPLRLIRPVNIRQYMTWRGERSRQWFLSKGRPVPAKAGHVRANREIALFSHIFNYARDSGMTDASNPCLGIARNQEEGRDVYVEESAYRKVWEVADWPLRDAMDLAYLTGQRPSDTARMTDHDIKDGVLSVKQAKTRTKVRIEVVGELATVIARIRERRNRFKVVTTALVVNGYGRPVMARTISEWLKQARRAAGVPDGDFQFRDLRAKAGTDKAESAKDARQAQKQLGHSRLSTTEIYLRNRRGEKVGPTR
ncbi:tyrosine-type recombinase/integrase [Bordetella bronchialis]|uniref:Integrase n=1 Tax=Bordetella bronchialis TaxID=463025 RepID=A0A193FV09_9BORD|nr:tyrosine-type recombinase/integrase [Bordetella bronchialis]ANN70879.1 integrase [Bordetella bronchialis]